MNWYAMILVCSDMKWLDSKQIWWVCLLTQVIGFAHDERTRLGRKVEFADVYHSANRYAVGSTMVPIVLPRSTLWSFRRGRLVLGRESMVIQGHTLSPDMCDELEVTESQLQDLAGNSLPDWLAGGGRYVMWVTVCVDINLAVN